MQNIFFVKENGEPFPAWENKKLGSIACLKNGYSFDSKSYQENGEYLVTTISNVTGDVYVDSSGSKRVIEIPSDIRPHQILKVGDILVSLTGNVGRISIVNENNLLLNQRVGLIEINDSSIDRSFIYQILSNKVFEESMINAGQGAAQKNIKKEDIENYQINLPSLPEQKKIAEFFSALDERIELTADKVKLLKEQKQGYLQRVFSGDMAFTDDNGNAYPEWEQKKLGEISLVKRGASPRPIADKRWFSDVSETGWVRISDVTSSRKYLLNTSQSLSPEGVEQSVKVEPGDLILSIAGSVGKPAITKVPVCIHDGFITFKNLTADTEYLYYFLENYRSKWKLLSQSSSQPNINSEILGKVKIEIPSLPEQQKIAEFFSALDDQIELNENKLALLKEQKKGYLQGIFG